MSHAAASLTAPAAAVRPAAGRGRRASRARVAIPRAQASSNDDVDASSSSADFSRRLALGSAAALVAVAPNVTPAAAADVKASFYDYTVEQYGKPFDLGAFKGDVTVVLNVASE
jgi:glutathione peroxidase